MNEISFHVTVEEANLILEGLGCIPFARVYALVAKIQEQAKRQLSGESTLRERAAAGDSAPVVGEQTDAK